MYGRRVCVTHEHENWHLRGFLKSFYTFNIQSGTKPFTYCYTRDAALGEAGKDDIVMQEACIELQWLDTRDTFFHYGRGMSVSVSMLGRVGQLG